MVDPKDKFEEGEFIRFSGLQGVFSPWVCSLMEIEGSLNGGSPELSPSANISAEFSYYGALSNGTVECPLRGTRNICLVRAFGFWA